MHFRRKVGERQTAGLVQLITATIIKKVTRTCERNGIFSFSVLYLDNLLQPPQRDSHDWLRLSLPPQHQPTPSGWLVASTTISGRLCNVPAAAQTDDRFSWWWLKTTLDALLLLGEISGGAIHPSVRLTHTHSLAIGQRKLQISPFLHRESLQYLNKIK